MNIDSPFKKTQSSQNNGFHGSGVAQPLYRGRRLSEVMLEYFAHAAPLLAAWRTPYRSSGGLHRSRRYIFNSGVLSGCLQSVGVVVIQR